MLNRNRRLVRASALSGAALVALIEFGATASAQDAGQGGDQRGAQGSQPAGQGTSPPGGAGTGQPAGPVSGQGSGQPSTQAGKDLQLPQVTVHGARKPKAQPHPVARRTAPAISAPRVTVPPISPAEALTQKGASFDQARSNLYT